MEFLRFLVIIIFSTVLISVTVAEGAVCQSTQEFKTVVEYLRKQKMFSLPDSEVFKIALTVSENCNGASGRFKKMLDAMVKTGVDHSHALKFAVSYSQEDTESVDAFLSLFQGLVVEKKFNLPYYEAFQTAKYFAESSKGNKKVLKNDFMGFLKFCFEDSNGAMLSLDQCRHLSLKYLELHKQYPQGVYKDFISLFRFLREEKHTALPISKALLLTHEVLKNGPGSKKNFIDSYNYGLNKMNLTPEQSLSLSMKLASFSKRKNEK